jgi:hypothetical protein
VNFCSAAKEINICRTKTKTPAGQKQTCTDKKQNLHGQKKHLQAISQRIKQNSCTCHMAGVKHMTPDK